MVSKSQAANPYLTRARRHGTFILCHTEMERLLKDMYVILPLERGQKDI